jgi:hypothetical protein
VRWWAAQGCTVLGPAAAPAEAAIRRRLEDRSGSVAVAAAEALARIGRVEAALPVLERLVLEPNPPGVIQQAGNVLDRLGELARPSLAAMKRAAASAQPTKPGTYAPQYILNHAIAVLEGRTTALVYPPAPGPSP